jgi:hypothetical protein
VYVSVLRAFAEWGVRASSAAAAASVSPFSRSARRGRSNTTPVSSQRSASQPSSTHGAAAST